MSTRLKLLIVLVVAFVLLFGGAARSQTAAPVARLSCERPSALRLLRFEDGSAVLRCGDRLLARISAPG